MRSQKRKKAEMRRAMNYFLPGLVAGPCYLPIVSRLDSSNERGVAVQVQAWRSTSWFEAYVDAQENTQNSDRYRGRKDIAFRVVFLLLRPRRTC